MQKLAPTLDKGPIPLKPFRDAYRSQLLDLLDAIRGRKALILEADFISPLGTIADAVTLKEHGIEMFCVLESQPTVLPALQDKAVRHLVYLVHTRMESINAAIGHVRACQAAGTGFEYTLITMPRKTEVAEMLLNQAGLLGDVAVRTSAMDWIPLDEDVVSLEDAWAFKELAVDRNPSSLYYVARALTHLQATIGAIPHIKGKGDWAAAVHRIMTRMRQEQGTGAPTPGGDGGIDTLILLDRTMDLVTPMCTQLTYEGLLDEVLGLAYGQIRSGAAGEGGKKIHGLTSADAVFAETRDKFYVGARKWMNDTLKTIQQFRDSGMQSADISRLRGFVADLKEKFVRIPLHTKLIEQLATALQAPSFAARQQVEGGLLNEGDELPGIEDLMYQGEALTGVLRLLCLYCAVHGGIPKRSWDALRRDLLNTFGHQHVLTLAALQKAGLLQKREGRKSHFPPCKSAFKLLLPEGEVVDEDNPQDIHFAYAGYAPLSARLVQQALTEGWAAADSTMTSISGSQFEFFQTVNDLGMPVEKSERGRGLSNSATAKKKTVMVMFIGGVTYAEISALRYLSRKGVCNCNFVVATTKVVNGASLVETLMPEGVSVKTEGGA